MWVQNGVEVQRLKSIFYFYLFLQTFTDTIHTVEYFHVPDTVRTKSDYFEHVT